MIENIDRVLERGERIELLVDKTDRLNQQAFKFEKTVRTLLNHISTVSRRVLIYTSLLFCTVPHFEEHYDLAQVAQYWSAGVACCGKRIATVFHLQQLLT